MVLVPDTSSRRGLQVYQVSLKNFNGLQVIELTRFVTDRQTDRQTDRRTGKNNMSPDPVGGRHNKTKEHGDIYTFCIPHLHCKKYRK